MVCVPSLPAAPHELGWFAFRRWSDGTQTSPTHEELRDATERKPAQLTKNGGARRCRPVLRFRSDLCFPSKILKQNYSENDIARLHFLFTFWTLLVVCGPNALLGGGGGDPCEASRISSGPIEIWGVLLSKSTPQISIRSERRSAHCI